MTNKKSKVMTIANKLVAQGYSRRQAMIKAWVLVKMPLVESKVSGVTFQNRQRIIERLTHYTAEEININLVRENGNQYDANAVAVMVSVNGSREVCVGYLPKALAQFVSPLVDAGKAVQGAFKEIRGKKYTEYMNYGLVVQIQV